MAYPSHGYLNFDITILNDEVGLEPFFMTQRRCYMALERFFPMIGLLKLVEVIVMFEILSNAFEVTISPI